MRHPLLLHLGCGGTWLPGHLNVDAFDRSVADVVADARALPFLDERFDGAVALHVIEHLGYLGALRALGELHRVLRPGGRVILETPDLRRSFRRFLRARRTSARAEQLTWIFGEDSPGGAHRLLLPRELLALLLRRAGFAALRWEPPRTHLHRDGLRVVARRRGGAAERILPHLRTRLDRTAAARPCHPREALELESRIADAVRHADDPRATERRVVAAALELTAVLPDATIAWMDLAVRFGARPAVPMARRLAALARRASQSGFPRAVSDGLWALTERPNRVADGYDHVLGAAVSALRAALAEPTRDPAVHVRRKLGIPAARLPLLAPFTRERAVREVARLRDRGIRRLAHGEAQAALEPLRRAVLSKLESVCSVWNLAVAQAALGRWAPAVWYYDAALRFPVPRAVRRRLRLERATCLLRLGDPGAALRSVAHCRGREAERVRAAARAMREGRRSPLPAARTRPVAVGEEVHVRP